MYTSQVNDLEIYSRKRIKILQLGSPTGLYGAERWILALVKHLDPQTFRSIVGVIQDDPSQDAQLCQEAEKSGYQTQIFKSDGRFSFGVIKKIKDFILQEKIDILHTHFYKTDLVGFWATRGTHCKIISTPHGWTQSPDIKLRIYELVDRMIFPFLDAVVPLSGKIFQELERIPKLKSKLYLIKNGVDLTEVTSGQKNASELMEWKKEGVFILGYIGRLVNGKGLDVLLGALGQLKGLNWKLVIIGEGEEELNLKRLSKKLKISDKILFLGFRPDRISFLQGFDVFVLPSKSEGTPRCVMEAMAAMVLVIASDIPGCRNLILNEQTGFLFPVDSADKLSEQIMIVAKNIVNFDQIKVDAFTFISQNFSAKRMAKDYKNLFLKLLE